MKPRQVTIDSCQSLVCVWVGGRGTFGKEERHQGCIWRRDQSPLPKARSRGVRAIPAKVPHLVEEMMYAEAAKAMGALARDPAQRTTLAAGTAIPSGAIALRRLVPPLAAAWKFEDGDGIVRAACGGGDAAAAGGAPSDLPEGSPLPDIGDCSGYSFARCFLIRACKVPQTFAESNVCLQDGARWSWQRRARVCAG